MLDLIRTSLPIARQRLKLMAAKCVSFMGAVVDKGTFPTLGQSGDGVTALVTDKKLS